MKECESFEEFSNTLGLVKYEEGKRLMLEAYDRKIKSDPDFENSLSRTSLLQLLEENESGGELSIFACSDTARLCHFAQENLGLSFATEVIEDLDCGGSAFICTNGLHTVNRERFFLASNDTDCFHEELFERDEEEGE